jgi:hypothetical protein
MKTLNREERTMKRLTIFGAILLVLSISGLVMAADTDNHQVTVQVTAINEVGITGGNITLTINSASAGSQPTDAVDNSTCDLAWSTNQSSKKITVQSNLGTPTFSLKVVAQNVTGGTAGSEVTVSTSAQDFVSSISTTVGSCDLQYTASATLGDGTGSDVHTITYTMTDS